MFPKYIFKESSCEESSERSYGRSSECLSTYSVPCKHGVCHVSRIIVSALANSSLIYPNKCVQFGSLLTAINAQLDMFGSAIIFTPQEKRLYTINFITSLVLPNQKLPVRFNIIKNSRKSLGKVIINSRKLNVTTIRNVKLGCRDCLTFLRDDKFGSISLINFQIFITPQ